MQRPGTAGSAVLLELHSNLAVHVPCAYVKLMLEACARFAHQLGHPQHALFYNLFVFCYFDFMTP